MAERPHRAYNREVDRPKKLAEASFGADGLPELDTISWPPTRAEGLRRLEEFLPHAGRDYAETRNHDLGPDDRSNVSVLSPYLRHRLIGEEEVVAAVLGRHGYRAAEKFLQEVAWRTYWKGWLELRPGVWGGYRAEVRGLLDALDRDPDLGDRFERATGGGSGIGCLDAWAGELVEVGYLHNHARMWFASLWVFTLDLPWALGADFFFRHLLDGDPASNTLSWRWVAGLQTRGKTYLAQAENIAKYTGGRFRPKEPLARSAPPIEGPAPPPPGHLTAADRPDGEGPAGLLLTEEDLWPESLGLHPGRIAAVAGVTAAAERSPMPVSPPVIEFTDRAMEDGLARASAHLEAPAVRLEGPWELSVVAWAREQGLRRVATAHAPAGPARERLDLLDDALALAGIHLARLRRPWDDLLWPQATSGYFGFKAKLEPCLARLGLLGPGEKGR